MRPKARPRPGVADAPRVVHVGVLEVWAGPGFDWHGARRRWEDHRTAWRAASGLDDAAAFRALPPRAFWSLAAMDDAGQGAVADRWLQGVGVTRANLDALRAEADALTAVSASQPRRSGRA